MLKKILNIAPCDRHEPNYCHSTTTELTGEISQKSFGKKLHLKMEDLTDHSISAYLDEEEVYELKEYCDSFLNLKKINEEFKVKILREDIGFKIPLCGLCGNCGIIDTRSSATWNEKKVGLISYCICENGRALKETAPNLSIQEMEDKISCMAMKMF